MRVCIIGGGNIGTAMAVMIAASGDRDTEIVLHTSKTAQWDSTFYGVNGNSGKHTDLSRAHITNHYAEAVCDADVVLITHPSFMVSDTISAILPHLKQSAMVGVIPGSGGAEFFSRCLTDTGHVFFGADRVPCISRKDSSGNSVVYFPKAGIRIGAIPEKKAEAVCNVVGKLLGIACLPLQCYLTVTLTPSNPILHTSRLYAMFRDYRAGETVYSHNFLFYREWDMLSSTMLLACDAELQKICRMFFELPLQVIPIPIHYESATPESLTAKIRSIRSLENIESPMIEIGNGFIPDLRSRYFLEDFSYGLCIIKAFAVAGGVEVPNIDAILHWYERLMHLRYYKDNEFFGEDLAMESLPQGYGLFSVKSIVDFYKR